MLMLITLSMMVTMVMIAYAFIMMIIYSSSSILLLRNINLLHTLVNSHTLSLDTIKAVIAQMRRTFIKLLTTFHMSESLKLHIIFSH